jgi:hypothetical protein
VRGQGPKPVIIPIQIGGSYHLGKYLLPIISAFEKALRGWYDMFRLVYAALQKSCVVGCSDNHSRHSSASEARKPNQAGRNMHIAGVS